MTIIVRITIRRTLERYANPGTNQPMFDLVVKSNKIIIIIIIIILLDKLHWPTNNPSCVIIKLVT